MSINRRLVSTALAIQWLRLCTFNAGGMGSVPSWEKLKISCAEWHGQNNNNKN